MEQRFSKFYYSNIRNEICYFISENSMLHVNSILRKCVGLTISLFQKVKSSNSVSLQEVPTDIISKNNITQQFQFENLLHSRVIDGKIYTWTNISEFFLFTLHLGAAHVFQITQTAIDTMQLCGSIPDSLFET